MKRNPQAVFGDNLKTFQHGAGGRRRQIAEGIPHETFEACNSAFNQRFKLIDIVLGKEAVEAVIDVRFACRFLFSFSAAGLAVGGSTFGISNTVVTPPMAAAAVPVCQSSLWV